MKNKTVLFIVSGISLVLGILLRIYFLYKPGYQTDIGSFLQWGNQIKDGGFWSLFGGNYYQTKGIDYPPLIPLITSWWLSFGSVFPKINLVAFFKILPTIFELALVVISALYIIKSKSKYIYILLPLVLIQPAMALVTSAWGQVDVIMSLFILLAFLALDKNKYLTTILLFLAVITKPQAAIAIGIYFLYLLLKEKFLDFISQLLFFFLLIAITILIFTDFGNSSFLSVYLNSVGHYTSVSLHAFNIWWLGFGIKSWNVKDTLGSPITYKMLGFILLILSAIPVVVNIIRSAKKPEDLLLLTSYSCLAFFLLPTEMHERYLFPTIALMAIPAAKNRGLLISYILISATFFLNCYAVLQSTFPQFSIGGGNLLAGGWTKVVALVNILIIIYLAIYLILAKPKLNNTKKQESK